MKLPLQRKRNRFILKVNEVLYPASAIKEAVKGSPFQVNLLTRHRGYKELELKTPKISEALKWVNYLFWAVRAKNEDKK